MLKKVKRTQSLMEICGFCLISWTNQPTNRQTQLEARDLICLEKSFVSFFCVSATILPVSCFEMISRLNFWDYLEETYTVFSCKDYLPLTTHLNWSMAKTLHRITIRQVKIESCLL